MSSAIQKTKLDVWKDDLALRRPAIEKLLPSHLSVERFVQQVINAMIRNPKLQDCSKLSVLDSVMALAELGLDPSGALGSGYLIPFKGICTPVPGFRGLIDLAVRSGEVRSIHADVVFWGDEFDWEKGDKPRLWHRPMRPESKEQQAEIQKQRVWDNVRAAYAVATLRGGLKQFDVMLFEDLEAARRRAPGGNYPNTPWATDRIEMYKKTPIRRLVKQLPLSPVKARELAMAIELEEKTEEQFKGQTDDIEVPEEKAVANPLERLKDQMRRRKTDEPPEDAQTVPEPPEDVKLPTWDDQPKVR